MTRGSSLPMPWPGPLLRRVLVAAILLIAPLAISSQMTAAQARSLQAKIRAALYVPKDLPALDAKNYGSFEPLPDVVAERVTYATEYGLRVPAIVYRPRTITGKIPAMVVVNGHGGDKSSWYSWYTGVMYAKAGAVVLTYDPIGEGERNDEHRDGTGEHDRLIDEPGVARRMGGSMITDVMQAVSYLDSLEYVDARRIGVLGFSMGSFVAALAGAVDNRIHAVLLTGGGDLDGPGGYWDSSKMVMCQSGPYRALRFLGDRPAVLFTLAARRGPTLIVNGTADTVVAIPEHGPTFFNDLRQRVMAMNGSERNVFTTYFDEGASHRPAWVTPRAATWLDHNLHFAAWREGAIGDLPTIRIDDWAAKNQVHLSASALREDRDAGLVAIDVGVPGLTPEQLSAAPIEEWETQRNEFVYSAWARDAIAAARAEPGAAETAGR